MQTPYSQLGEAASGQDWQNPAVKSILHFLILVVGLGSCSNGTAESPETESFHQVLLHLSLENKRILGRTNPGICGFALGQDFSSKYKIPRWEDDPIFRKYVDEAKRRGFSAHSCAAMFGWQSAQTKHVQGKVGGVEYRLIKLRALYDEGLIAQSKYDEIRRQILEAH